MVGSLLAKASLSAKASRFNRTLELQPPAALNGDEEVQAALPLRAPALNPSQEVQARGRELVWGDEQVARLTTDQHIACLTTTCLTYSGKRIDIPQDA